MLVVLTTIKNSAAGRRLAKVLVKERLVACVNIVPQVISIYTWKKKLVDETESLLIMKTTSRRWATLQKRIEELHPYEVPEIVVLPLSKVSKKYGAWIKEVLG